MMRTLLATYSALLAAACAGAPLVRPGLDLTPLAALRPEHFPGAAAVLSGFAGPDGDLAIRVGDAALLGVEIRNGGEAERFMLLLEVTSIPHWEYTAGSLTMKGRPYSIASIAQNDEPEREYKILPVTMQLARLDADGRNVATSTAEMFEEPLRTGFWPYALTEADTADLDLAFALTMTLQRLATADPVLQDLLFRIVDRPSLWSVATHLGVTVAMRWGADPSPVEPQPPLAAPLRCTTLELKINGDTASWVDMVVAETGTTSAACGGLVGAIARHPTAPDRSAVVRLLATRRGPPP